MKKGIAVLAVVLFAGLALCVSDGNAQMGPAMMGGGYGPGYGGNYCPNCGQYLGPRGGYGMGPGMMGGGYGMGPGMMRRGYGMGPGMGPGMMGPGYGYGPQPQSQYGYGPQYQQPQKPLDKDQIKRQVEDYLRYTRNPNLKMGQITEKDDTYEVDIETKDGSLADKVLVDKYTGQMRSAY
ncbi:conserved exported hypothetical protein [uncultured Desulfatiglans sp.]|nr:conserved exported hypothetical protein [uncultured Desulfatiglans sp.]